MTATSAPLTAQCTTSAATMGPRTPGKLAALEGSPVSPFS